MSDLDRIRRALAYRQDIRDELEFEGSRQVGNLEILADAARRFLQIAEQSERSVWCEEHNAPQWRGDESKHGGRLEFGSCRIVEKWTFVIEEDE